MEAPHRIIAQGLLIPCAHEQNARCSPPALRNPLILRRGCTDCRRWRRGRTHSVAPVTVFFLRSFFSSANFSGKTWSLRNPLAENPNSFGCKPHQIKSLCGISSCSFPQIRCLRLRCTLRRRNPQLPPLA
ncbi:hypothetical protein U1Q18_025729 [Sarracenia purpurea var. burkii]